MYKTNKSIYKRHYLLYCPGPTKYMWHPTWHSGTRVNPPRQSYNKNVDTQPLVVELPNWEVISNLLIFEYLYLLTSS